MLSLPKKFKFYHKYDSIPYNAEIFGIVYAYFIVDWEEGNQYLGN